MSSIPLSLLTSLLFLFLTLPTLIHSTSSPKRGLCYVDPASPSDDKIWTSAASNLTWYYNYEYTPTPSLASTTISFVPMLWGSPPSPTEPDGPFLSAINSLMDSPDPDKRPTHILSFNEPDGPPSTGGSALTPTDAAASYLLNLSPLRQPPYNLRISLPAVTGSQRGIDWLRAFNTSCLALSPHGEGCEADFIPVHFYGSFEGFASFLGQIRALYPQLPIWVTEFALPDSRLPETQAFFNSSTGYLDRLTEVERYAWFGAFRGQSSNVGASAAFLSSEDGGGQLTDLGAWYLGREGTGRLPGEARVGLGLRGIQRGEVGVLLGVVLGVVGLVYGVA